MQNLSRKHGYKLWVTFQNPSSKTMQGAPQWGYYHDVIYGLQENGIISETVHDRGKIAMPLIGSWGRSLSIRH